MLLNRTCLLFQTRGLKSLRSSAIESDSISPITKNRREKPGRFNVIIESYSNFVKFLDLSNLIDQDSVFKPTDDSGG